MKISEIEIKDLFYELLSDSTLKGGEGSISGGIYKDQRPINSELEDAIISVLSSTSSQIQGAIVNINIYVPDIIREDEPIENTPRLRELCRLCLDMLDGESRDGFKYSIASQNIFKANDIPFHVINNRLNFEFCSE